MSGDELEALHQTLFRLEQRWLPPTPDAHVWFAYDPLPAAIFLEGIRPAVTYARGRRFLDVGCGIGTKLVFMHYLGWRVAGIDRHGPYLEVARELIPEAELVQANALDVERFDADVVYMYRPAVSDELQLQLERHVVDRVAPGTVLFLPARWLPDEWGLERLDTHVWVR